jgi:hypothetical protein
VFRLCTKTHSAGFLLKIFICNSALCNSVWNPRQTFYFRLRAMQHSVESLIFVNFSENLQQYAKMI